MKILSNEQICIELQLLTPIGGHRFTWDEVRMLLEAQRVMTLREMQELVRRAIGILSGSDGSAL